MDGGESNRMHGPFLCLGVLLLGKPNESSNENGETHAVCSMLWMRQPAAEGK